MSLLTRLLPAILLAASPPLAFAAGDLSNSSVYSETDASNNTSTDPGWPEGMAPSRVNDAARALQGALKRDWDRRGPTVTSAGTDTITLTYSVAPTAYVQGDSYCFKAGGTNTGAATLNVNALGVKSIKKGAAGATALAAGDITSGGIYCLQYDGTNMQLVASTAAVGAALSLPVSVANGGTASSSASGTAVDNISGFGSTGMLARTGAGAYSFRTVTAGTGISVSNGNGVSGNPTVAIDTTVVEQIGKKTISIPGSAWLARTSNGAATSTTESTTNKINRKTIDFVDGSQTFAQAVIAMPKSWNLSTLSYRVYFDDTVANNSVVWQLQALCLRDNDTIDTAFGTAVAITEGVNSATTVTNISAESGAVTAGGTCAANSALFLQLYRDGAAGGDSNTGTAKVYDVQIYYTTNAGNDS
jgi:hypothetical protein